MAGEPHERRRLLLATVAALVVALFVLVAFIYPAEYGKDPLGTGRLLGLTALSGEADAGPSGGDDVATNATFRFQAVWPTSDTGFDPVAGYLAEGQARSVPLALALSNVVVVRATVSWDDANETAGESTAPDLFEVQVVGPDGRRGAAVLGRNDATGAGVVEAELRWRDPPAPRLVVGADAAEALDRARRASPPDESGRGTWTVNLTLLDAGDGAVAGVPLGGPARDDGNDWTLAVAVTTYALDEERLAASSVREDQTRLRLAPGRGVEVKFALVEGALLEYEWTSSPGGVLFDFHGEREGDDSGAFTSHRAGTASSDEGSLVAPFTGSHGWYWENRGSAEVVIDLRTVGDYEVIGKR